MVPSSEPSGARAQTSCLVLSCLVLSCLVLSCLVLSCLVLSCLVLSCLVLSCCCTGQLRLMESNGQGWVRMVVRLLFMYKNVCTELLEDLSQSSPLKKIVRPPKRHIQPKHFPDHVSSNFVQQLTTNNIRCLIVPTAHTEQFKNTFFVKTIVIDWIQLNESQVQAETITDFSRLISITCAHTQ